MHDEREKSLSESLGFFIFFSTEPALLKRNNQRPTLITKEIGKYFLLVGNVAIPAFEYITPCLSIAQICALGGVYLVCRERLNEHNRTRITDALPTADAKGI